jgi:ferritin-like metal-binding protein YciE
METLHDLFTDEMKDMFSAETQLTKALPRMAKNATNPQLKRAFEQHLKETEEHVRRIERLAAELDIKPRGKKCMGMEGLIEEGKEVMNEAKDPDVMDAGLIGAAQKVEHYEIAGYGTARTYAQLLGNEEAARLLQETLDEEGETDKKLTALAESLINVEAAQGANL